MDLVANADLRNNRVEVVLSRNSGTASETADVVSTASSRDVITANVDSQIVHDVEGSIYRRSLHVRGIQPVADTAPIARRVEERVDVSVTRVYLHRSRTKVEHAREGIVL